MERTAEWTLAIQARVNNYSRPGGVYIEWFESKIVQTPLKDFRAGLEEVPDLSEMPPAQEWHPVVGSKAIRVSSQGLMSVISLCEYNDFFNDELNNLVVRAFQMGRAYERTRLSSRRLPQAA